MSDLRGRLNLLRRLIGRPEARCAQCGSVTTVFYAETADDEAEGRCIRCGGEMPVPAEGAKMYIGVPLSGKDAP
jgi:hypothetical protein